MSRDELITGIKVLAFFYLFVSCAIAVDTNLGWEIGPVVAAVNLLLAVVIFLGIYFTNNFQ